MKSILASKAPCAWEAYPDSSPKWVKCYSFFLFLSLTEACPFVFLSFPIRLKTPLVSTVLSETLIFLLTLWKPPLYPQGQGLCSLPGLPCFATSYPDWQGCSSFPFALFCTEAVEHHSYKNSLIIQQLCWKECNRPTPLDSSGRWWDSQEEKITRLCHTEETTIVWATSWSDCVLQ